MTAAGSSRRDETSPLLGNRKNGLIQEDVENVEDSSSLPSEDDKPKVNLTLLVPAVGIGVSATLLYHGFPDVPWVPEILRALALTS